MDSLHTRLLDKFFRQAQAWGLVVSLVVFSSCATVIKAPHDTAPELILPAGALAYARLDQPIIAEALKVLAKGDVKGAEAIAERTMMMTAAIVRQEDSSTPGILAVADGRYPAGAASMKLATDKAWKRDGAVWERTDGSMRLAFTNGDRAFFGTGPIDGLVLAASSPNPNPIPDRYKDAWSASVAVYLPNPIAFLSERIPLGNGEIPLLAMFVSAYPTGGLEYEASIIFEFETARTALIFSPLCRVFLYAASHALWPDRAATVLDDAVWTVSGTTVTASRLRLDAASIAGFFGGVAL